MRIGTTVFGLTLAAGLAAAGTGAVAWSLEEAARPYAGTTVDVVFLLRPGYEAAEAMLPEFEEKTGIKVNIVKHPYENALGEQVRDFVAGGDFDIALIDLVWIGNFAENGWIVPIDKFTSNPDLADPELDLDDFFPLVLNAFGGWGGTIYGPRSSRSATKPSRPTVSPASCGPSAARFSMKISAPICFPPKARRGSIFARN